VKNKTARTNSLGDKGSRQHRSLSSCVRLPNALFYCELAEKSVLPLAGIYLHIYADSSKRVWLALGEFFEPLNFV